MSAAIGFFGLMCFQILSAPGFPLGKAAPGGKYKKLPPFPLCFSEILLYFQNVALLLKELGLEVEKQPPSANVDLKARSLKLNIGFAVKVTGTKDVIHKDSAKAVRAWQYLNERVGTAEEKDRLIIVANTQYHLDPNKRNRESYTPEITKLLSGNGVLMITTIQLYELWKVVHEKIRAADDIVRELHSKWGLFVSSS